MTKCLAVLTEHGLVTDKQMDKHTAMAYTGWAKKRTVLRVDSFVMVSGRKACDISKVFKFCLWKSIKLVCQWIKYSLPNLHKYSLTCKYTEYETDAWILPNFSLKYPVNLTKLYLYLAPLTRYYHLFPKI